MCNPRGAVVAYLEDDCLIADTMVDIFEGLGCRLIMAADGEEMMAKLASNDLVPDVVVSDFFLPGDNGAVMIARIRLAIDRAVPAILLTGYGVTSELMAQMPSNVTLLTKPVWLHTLQETLAALGVGVGMLQDVPG
jgi:CheY-like chemotaxis protein